MVTRAAQSGKTVESKGLKLKNDEKLLVPDYWKIESIKGNMAYVTDGKMTGKPRLMTKISLLSALSATTMALGMESYVFRAARDRMNKNLF